MKTVTNVTMDDFIRFFKDKPVSCKETNAFVAKEENRQTNTGYIALANAISKRDSKLCDKILEGHKEYCEDLFKHDDEGNAIEWVAEQLGIEAKYVKEIDPMHIPCNEKGIVVPSQKWHLFVSYFGWKKYIGKKPYISRVSCPELWLWMFESSGHSSSEIKDIYEQAELYRNGNKNKESWNDYCKGLAQKLNDVILKTRNDII